MSNKRYSSLDVIIIYIIICFASNSTNELFSQQINGGYSSAYLLRDVGSRAISMGGAYTAIANDPSAIFYNPAGFSYYDSSPTFFSSVSIAGLGRTHNSFAYGQMLNDNLGIGLGLNSFASQSFIGRDIMGNNIGNLRDWQYSFSGALAYKMGDFGMGVTAKYIGRALDGTGTSANGFAFDVGTKLNVADMFSFGATIQNIGGTLKWNTQSGLEDIIPYTIRTGIAMEIELNESAIETRSNPTGDLETIIIPSTEYILFSTDLVFSQFQKTPYFVLGSEVQFHESIAVRGGIDIYGESEGKNMFFPLERWGAGLSIKPYLEEIPFFFSLDYSIFSEVLLQQGISHNISIIINFN